jgi:hypothetical protein
MQAMPGTHEYSEASQLSHWLTVAKQGADGMLPVDYYRVQVCGNRGQQLHKICTNGAPA